ncbi:MAG: 5'/3'-nucleotidase SurE [Spirochaetota bacterium]|nr:5'/3'-nucleotidase SurE [Spirochaetota bacterium]
MNILLTNDDGMYADGINSLFRVLSNNHNVYMIAPNEEKSGSSSAITLRDRLKVENISDKQYIVHGFPVDCVSVGLNGKFLPEIDLVISGINHGANLGDDVYFSGTVAAARASFIFGVSGISISIDCTGNSAYFSDAAEFLLDFIDNLNNIVDGKPICLNINYPDIAPELINGIKYTFLGKRKYIDLFKIVNKSDCHMSLQLEGTISSHENIGSDITEVKRGYISITPMTLDCTDYTYLQKLITNPKVSD